MLCGIASAMNTEGKRNRQDAVTVQLLLLFAPNASVVRTNLRYFAIHNSLVRLDLDILRGFRF